MKREAFKPWRSQPEEEPPVPQISAEEREAQQEAAARVQRELEERMRAEVERSTHVPTREELLQQEQDHVQTQEFILGEPRYFQSPDSAQRLWTQLNGRPCTKENLLLAFNELVAVNGISVRPPEPEPYREPTLLEQAAKRGITKSRIWATDKKRLRELLADPFMKKLIDAVLAQPGN
jgi:hypothetical protein